MNAACGFCFVLYVYSGLMRLKEQQQELRKQCFWLRDSKPHQIPRKCTCDIRIANHSRPANERHASVGPDNQDITLLQTDSVQFAFSELCIFDIIVTDTAIFVLNIWNSIDCGSVSSIIVATLFRCPISWRFNIIPKTDNLFRARSCQPSFKRLFQHGLPIHHKLCFCFFQRFHPGIKLGEQFLNPGNNALLLREGWDGYFKILNDILRYGFKCCPCAF